MKLGQNRKNNVDSWTLLIVFVFSSIYQTEQSPPASLSIRHRKRPVVTSGGNGGGNGSGPLVAVSSNFESNPPRGSNNNRTFKNNISSSPVTHSHAYSAFR